MWKRLRRRMEQAVDIVIWKTHLKSLAAPLWYSCPDISWGLLMTRLESTLDAVSIYCSVVNVKVLSGSWLMLISVFVSLRHAMQVWELQLKTGWQRRGWEGEQCRCQKAHKGLSTMEVACLEVVVSWEINCLGLTIYLAFSEFLGVWESWWEWGWMEGKEEIKEFIMKSLQQVFHDLSLGLMILLHNQPDNKNMKKRPNMTF